MSLEFSGNRSFAQNSLLNFATYIFNFSISLFCIPYFVVKLGTNAIGLLSILWLLVGYAGLLDLGLGQASTKFLSEQIAKNNREEVIHKIRSNIQLGILLSAIGCCLILFISFIGAEHFIQIPSSLQQEATWSLQLLAICLPAVILQGILRSIPVAYNRFDIVNGLQSINVFIQWVGSSIILLMGGGLMGIIFLTLFSRYVITYSYFRLALRLFPELRGKSLLIPARHSMDTLRYGGWITTAQIIGPLLIFFERTLIGKLHSLSFVAFYVLPFDALLKLTIFPMSLSGTLLPNLSGQWISDEGKAKGKILFHRSIKFTVIVMLPVIAALMLFSSEIMNMWLGWEFQQQSTTVFLLLSLGILFHSIAQLPNAALQALNRPDMIGKLLIVEVLVYPVFCFFLTLQFGIIGTAVAWLFRVFSELVVLLLCSSKVMKSVSVKFNYTYIWKNVAFSVIGSGILYIIKAYYSTMLIWIIALGVILVFYTIFTWKYVFDESDKKSLAAVKTVLSF
ncbi:MAG: hypothetical protein EPO24_06555 [Bacteroidetes bacterium]|nr:MAG: hypothetical protein EPO24_06555 [Bacteroidota bacterium]